MCTAVRFDDGQNNMYFGRNLDWSEDYGEKIVFAPHDYHYAPAFNAEDKNHPVIGIGIIVEDTPLYFDCMNDAGLAVAGLNFAKYCKYATEAVNFTTNVAAYEFPLWVTRNFTSVDDVQEALKNVAIVGKPINDRFPVATLHWIIADNTRSIVVECTEDGMHVYDDDVDVLTNQPPFPQQIEHLDNYAYVSPRTGKSVKWGSSELETNQDSNSSQGLPGGYGSMARFVRAAYNNTHYPTQSGENANVNRLFKTLSTAAVIEGTAISANGEFEKTLFSDCYSTATQTVYLKKYDDMAVHSYAVKDFDASSNQLQSK